jgi:hypothetical protein
MSAIDNLDNQIQNNESEDHVSNNAIPGISITRAIEATENDDR